MSKAKTQAITVDTTVNAPAAKAWKVWTEPQYITQWNQASADWHCPTVENDLKVGGNFSCHMAAKDGSAAFDFRGTYTSVTPHAEIAYTMEDGRKVTITFAAQGPQTRIVETFDAEDVNSLEMQRNGWQAILNNFKKVVEMNVAHKDQAQSFLRLVASGKVDEAYEAYVGADFRHHNPYFRGDAASLRQAMKENAVKNPTKILDIQRVVEEKDLVAVHSRVRQQPGDAGGAVVHIFRFQDDRIVELWDVGQPVPADSPNAQGMF